MREENKTIKIEAKTVAEAVKKALKELGVKRDQIKIEILREEEKGLFDMPGAKLAKIRATVL